jgi:hypothetical protein
LEIQKVCAFGCGLSVFLLALEWPLRYRMINKKDAAEKICPLMQVEPDVAGKDEQR